MTFPSPLRSKVVSNIFSQALLFLHIFITVLQYSCCPYVLSSNLMLSLLLNSPSYFHSRRFISSTFSQYTSDEYRYTYICIGEENKEKLLRTSTHTIPSPPPSEQLTFPEILLAAEISFSLSGIIFSSADNCALKQKQNAIMIATIKITHI